MARLFMALDVPQRLKDRLAEEIDRLRLAGAPVRWVRPAALHLTLRFLGEVPDRDLAEVHRILRDEGPGTGELRLVARGLGTFPEGEPRPRVVWCGVVGEDDDEQEALVDLNRRLDRRLRKAGFRRERGRFHPHLTLGRVRGPENADALLERLGPAARREFAHFVAQEVILYESRLDSEGAAYTPLEVVRLA